MKTLKQILNNIKTVNITGDDNISISGISSNSNSVGKSYLFVATKGLKTDGHIYINKAIEKGAVAIVHSDKIEKVENITYIQVKDTLSVLYQCAGNFYGNPSEHLRVIGVTGTNGKTTIATSLYTLFNRLGYKSGLISTISYRVGDKEITATHTTPDTITLNSLFAEMVSEGCKYCFMEVSSHAIAQKRTAGIDFDGAIFTNLTHEHLDYHKTFDNYLKTKKLLFDNLKKDAFALTNIDDKNGKIIIQNSKNNYTYSLKTIADFRAKIIETHFDATLVEFNKNELWLRFVGTYNVYNLLAVFAAANILLPEQKTEILQAISTLKPVAGRFEVVRHNDITGIIDYAHTPDAVKNISIEIKKLKNKTNKLITVIGAGGDRDQSKRPKMAAVANYYSDILILTSDNPRTEDPNKILDDMEKGITENSEYLKISDRKQAIKTAVLLAKKGDIILVAGKGHETYQEINGVRKDFDDKEILDNLLFKN